MYVIGPKYPVKVFSDYKNFTYWLTTKVLTEKQIQWVQTLAECNYRIEYVKRKENIRANAFSRKPKYGLNISWEYFTLFQLEDGIMVHNISQVGVVTIKVMEPYVNRIKKSYKIDTNAKKIL